MKRSHEKLLFSTVWTFTVAFLILLLYNDLIYIKILSYNLQPEFNFNMEIINEIGFMEQHENSDAKLVFNTGSKIESNPSARHRSASIPDIISTNIENLLTDLYKFSIYSPSYEKYMEYAPSHLLQTENPNLADIWNFTILDEMPNWKKFHYEISKNHLYEDSTIIEGLLQDMATQRIIANNTLVVHNLNLLYISRMEEELL
nr:uncharacterized protein LOC107437317 isoform X2 [Parasteatoda tepidariorum]